MPKKPKKLDDEEIIRRRDTDIDGASDERLDADARRALADARLRALAFALGSEQSTVDKKQAINDTDLLAYLLDTLPAERRLQLEQALRGDAHAFGRLMTLRATFNSPTDRRDRQQAENPARHIPRNSVGTIEIRSAGDVLLFKEAHMPRWREAASMIHSMHASLLSEHEPLFARSRLPSDFQSSRRRALQWGPKAEFMLRNMLERTERDLAWARMLIEEARPLLARWAQINLELEQRQIGVPTDEEPRRVEASRVGERLVELLNSVQERCDQIRGHIYEIIPSVTTDASLAASARVEDQANEDPLAELSRLIALRDVFQPDEDEELAYDFDREEWSETINVEAGPWEIDFAGTARPGPRLAITLSSVERQLTHSNPFLTLVRPQEGFETVDFDPSGRAHIALPRGDSTLLLQGDEVWQVRLKFRSA